jgi:nucleoside-diphosphate-sugar epimerase
VEPVPTAQERVEMLKERIPEANLNFDPDPALTQIYNSTPTFSDHVAREEWGWKPEYDNEEALDDFLSEIRKNPARYT